MPRPLLLLQVIAAPVVEHGFTSTRGGATLLLTAAARGKHEPRISDCSVQMALFYQLYDLACGGTPLGAVLRKRLSSAAGSYRWQRMQPPGDLTR